MEKITLHSHAKINLALDILGVENGYHLIQTVYQKIDLHDNVTIKLNDSGIIECEGKLATQAAEKFLQKIGQKNQKIKSKIQSRKKSRKGVMITIKKNIPYYSGLGGTSSNAATVLKGLNQMHGNPLFEKDLIQIATELGMDVAFFISEFDTALGTHFGEKIQKLSSCQKFEYKLYFPKLKKTSTKDIYEKLDLAKCGKNKNKTEKLIIALKKQNTKEILKNLHNDFEQLWEKPGHKSHITSQKFLLAGAGPAWVIFSMPPGKSSMA